MKKICCQLFIVAVFVSALLPARAETIVALMSDAKLRYFSSVTPGAWLKTVNLTGIPAAQTPAALDFRPDESLVVVTKEGTTLRTYTVDPNTGAAVQGQLSFTPATANAVAFDAFSHDAHATDLALTTDDDILHRFFFGPNGTSAINTLTLFYDDHTTDGDPADEHAGANPSIVALASTNSFKGAQAAALYGIDSTQNSLVKIDWETGSMDTIAALRMQDASPVPVEFRSGFDISGATGIAYIGQGTGATSTNLLTVDLTTGRVTSVGTIGPALQQTGINVVDISVPPPTNVVNISTRSRVGTGPDVMIAGFIAQGGATTRLIIRGIGPSLANAGVAGALGDPVLTVFDGNGIQIGTNDNWKSDQQTEITETGVAPGNDLEAAYVAAFSPGQYTAVVSGKDGATGVGLVEIYRLPDL